MGERSLDNTIDKLLQQLFDDEGLTRHSTHVNDIGTAFEIDWSAECLTAHGLSAMYIAVELKKMIMCGGDPITQALLSFKRSLSLEKYKHLLRMSCCPCLIMGIAGYQLTVVLAYFTDCVHVMELFTMSLKGPLDNFWLSERLPKFQIVRETTKRLREWYATIHTGSTLPQLPYLFPQPESIFPLLNPDSNEGLDAIKSLRLIFTEKVGPPEKSSHCLYRGVSVNSPGPPTKVYIKFVDCLENPYGQNQHRLLANHHLAPQLYLYCEVVRGTVMVVMDDLEACSLTPGFARKYIPTLRRDLVAAINILKGEKYVHGDLRPENVVLKQEKDETLHAYLIDFDWAGVAGKAKYPPVLNPDIDWPRPLEEMQGRVVMEDDDLIMLRKLLGDDNNNSAKRPREEDNCDMAGEGDRQACKKSRETSRQGGQSKGVRTSTGTRPPRTSADKGRARTSTGRDHARTSTGGGRARTSK